MDLNGLFSRSAKSSVSALALVGAAAIIGFGTEKFIGYRAVGFLFLVAVVAAGFLRHWSSVYLAALLGWTAWNFLFIPPRFTFAINSAEDVLMGATYLFVAIALGVLTRRGREADRLRESEKMHRTLLNSVSHELRTPLTAIITASTALSENPATDAGVRSLASEIGAGAERLNQVVENLLDMTRLSDAGIQLKKEWQDIEDLIGVTVSQALNEKLRARVKVEIENELPIVEIDFRLMEHALFNLVINALTYSSSKDVTVSAAKRANHILLSVDDRGPGIPKEHQAAIFTKFFRVPGSPPGGTGLGLSIVKSIAELHGGSVEMENRKDGGARFQILLPFRTPPPSPPESESK